MERRTAQAHLQLHGTHGMIHCMRRVQPQPAPTPPTHTAGPATRSMPHRVPPQPAEESHWTAL
eukprot:2077386-Prorocentrum_lima.AAC.1